MATTDPSFLAFIILGCYDFGVFPPSSFEAKSQRNRDLLPSLSTSSKDRQYLILEGVEVGEKVSDSKLMQDLFLLEFLQDHLAVCL